MFDPAFLDQIASYANAHGGMNSVEADDLRAAAARGDAFELPASTSASGAVVRQILVQAISTFHATGVPHAPVADGAGAPAVVASEKTTAGAGPMSIFERHMHLAKIAPSHDMAATVTALAASDMPLDQCEQTLRVAQQASLSAYSAIPTIEARAAGMAEMGSSVGFTPSSPKEAAKAGWSRAFAKAEAKASGTLKIGGV